MKIRYHQNRSTPSKQLEEQLIQFRRDFYKNHPRREIFFPEDHTLEKRKSLALKFSEKENFVHVGMGGSSLGPETLIKGLSTFKKKMNFHFLNNIDSDEVSLLLESIDLSKTLFYIVSKSGSTIETLSLLAIIDQRLQTELGENYNRSHSFVFCTDPKESDLLKLSKSWSVETLEIPTNIGGRFSALTDAGLFPLEMAGIDTFKVCEKITETSEEFINSSEGIHFAIELFEQYKNGVNQTVFMPYSSLLKSLSLWFVQLWAESLGKKNQEQKREGLTPLFTYGPTDQHSQMQLFMEGPLNKAIIFVEVEKTKNDLTFDSTSVNHPKIQLVQGKNLHDVLMAELKGTRDALKEMRIPHYTVEVPKVELEGLIKLFLFFEELTILMGELLKIDPFDQPGVELGKTQCLKHLEN